MNIQELDKGQYKKLERELSAHPLQSYVWGELKSPNWSPIRLGIFKGEEAIAIVSILTRTIPIIGKKFGYVPRGIVIKEGQSFEEVLGQIKDYGKAINLSHLMVDPDGELKIKNEKLKIIGPTYQEFGFKVSGRQIQPNRTVVLDLAKSEEELLADMRSKHRQYIRKAERNGVSIRYGSDNDIDAFCDIMKEIVEQRGYVLHECSYYKKVWKLFEEDEHVELFIAEKGKEVIGSYMVILNERNAYEMYGGCNAKGNKLLANYLMKWRAIKYCKQLGKRYYDQWGAEYKYPGLVQFKEGFGGEVVEFPPQYTYVYDKIGWGIYRILNKVNEALCWFQVKLGINR